MFVLDDELFELIQVARQRRRDAARQRPLRFFQLDQQSRQLVANGPLAQFRPVAHSRASLEFVKELIDFVNLSLESSQLRIVGVALLKELFSVFVQRLADGITLILAHGHKLGQIPALDHFDGGENHVLAHPHLFLEPKGLAAVVLAFETVGRFGGFWVRWRDQETHAGHLTFDPVAGDDLPFGFRRVVDQFTHLVLADTDL